MSNELTYESVLELIKESNKMLTEKFQETDRMLTEKFKETDKIIRNLGKNVGGLGKAIGNITEGLTFPSIAQELIDKFKVEAITENYAKRKKNKHIELDVFGYSNSVKNEAYIVEIKSTLDLDAIHQIEKTMLNFRELMPEHADKKLYGIISAIKAPKNLIEEVNKHGFYFATVKEGLFKVEIPKGFIPKVF